MCLEQSRTNEEEIDDINFLFKIPPIFDISTWLQSFNSSYQSIDISINKDQDENPHKSYLLKKWEIKKIDICLNPNFDKQGLLTKCSVIRIMFWYQKILEQMLFVFKKRMNKYIQTRNVKIEIIQDELDNFILNLNELTTKCEKRIENCLNSNIPDRIKQFQPLTQEQKTKLIDIFIQSFCFSTRLHLNYKEIAKDLGIDQKRVENFLFLKKTEIKKFLSGEGNLPKWINQKYFQQLNLLKQNFNGILS